MDVAIPADRNVVQKEAEKKLKYRSLCIELQRMWNLKCTIVPVIIGATGIVTRSLKKNLETIPGNHSIDLLQKTAILGTSHIIRKVLQCEAWSLSGGDHRWFKRSTRKKCLWQETYILYNNNNNNKRRIQGLNPGSEIFHTRPNWPWGLPIFLYNRYWVLGKAAGVWHWPPTTSSAKVKERVQLYLYSTSGACGLFYGELYHLPLIAVVAANIHYKIIEVTDFLLP